MLPLLGVFVANVLLIDVLGWVISGALLFFGCAWALGSRHHVRDALISVALSLVTFYGFYLGLGIHAAGRRCWKGCSDGRLVLPDGRVRHGADARRTCSTP